MKFDVILTNPPFQDSVNRKKTPHKLWIDFTLAVFDRLLVDGGSLVQVSPASFSSPSNVVLDLMTQNATRTLRFQNGSHFPDVGSSFSDYWIVKREHDDVPTRVTTASEEFTINLDGSVPYLPNDISGLSMSLHSKVMFRNHQRLPVEWDYVTCHNIRRRDQPPTLVEKESPSHPYPVFHTNRSTWYSSIRQDWAGEKKVMWTRSGYTKPFFDPGELGGTDMVYYIRVQDENEGHALTSNLNTSLFQYIFRTAKWSGFGNERVFSTLPEVPRERALSDEQMFAHFDITTEEAEYVDRTLAPRRRKAR